MAVKVGSFTKSTASATASQAITGVGFQPKALILWTACNTSADAFEAGVQYSIGFATGASDVGSMGVGALDAQATTVTSTRAAAKALTIVAGGESLIAECDLTSFDAGGFTLSWTTNNASAYIINYMALGGADITNAKVVRWTGPTANGDQAVTGVGFTPDVVLHVFGNIAGALPATVASAGLGVGAMSAAVQWVFCANDRDNQATTAARRYAAISDTLYFPTYGGTGTQKSIFADYVSMDADGFTVNYSVHVDNTHVFSLCLTGNLHLGTFVHDAAESGNDAETGVGFTPGGVLVLNASRQDATGSAATSAMFSMGAFTPTTQVAALWESLDAAADSDTAVYSSASAIGGEDAADQSIDSLLTYVAMGADGFTVNHSSTPVDTTVLYGYLAVKTTGGTTAPKMMHYKRLRTQ